MSDTERAKAGSPGFYKDKAQELLRQAELASTDEARMELLALAQHWQRLAQRAEFPSW